MKIEYTIFCDTKGRILYTKNDDLNMERNYFTFSRPGEMIQISEDRLSELVAATLSLSEKLRETLEQALRNKKEKE